MKRLVLSTAAALLGALIGLGVVPALAAQGCGVGFHRGPYGYCRPNYGAPYVAGGVYRGGAYAYRGVYGGRVYGRRGYAVRGYGHRVGHYGGRYGGGGRFGGGRRGWR
ncbi:hypothetical protein VQ02_25770 [Methylobacterium variabile]|jgi:hypothetical protein|uniref:Uncharacterized protein n=1 Tax=Methylobacterium variabile TaxID=298794 RepID=A0A0J6SDA1_9HYPH|nr:hypothetical protein [Methylobacterium variabile]KMO31624.1 hypothetical protein VQ02_25770 [Methylobacterium variabile]